MMDQAHNLRNLMEKRRQKIQKLLKNKEIKIYCVASGKGGVGKTNTVVNLAILLQKKGRKVLIVDADLGTANVNILLNIYSEVTLFDVFFNDKSLKEVIIEGPEGIQIIPGCSGMAEIAKLEPTQRSKLAEEFLKLDDFDTILIDTGAGISMNIMSFIAFSQEILIVTTPEPTSMTDAYGLLKVISELNLDRKINVIVNQVSNKETALFTYERLKNTVEKFLNIKLEYLGYILDDMRVKNAVMDRKPLIQEYPDSIASKCLMAINDKMIGTNNQEIKLCTMSQVYNRLIKVFG